MNPHVLNFCLRDCFIAELQTLNKIFTLKDLRNAIAHNGIIFDTRFATKKVPERICKMLEQEMQTKSLDFNYIVSYIALLVFMLNKMGESKKCKSMINEFLKLHEILRKLPVECLLPIKGTFFEHTIKAMGNMLKCEFKLWMCEMRGTRKCNDVLDNERISHYIEQRLRWSFRATLKKGADASAPLFFLKRWECTTHLSGNPKIVHSPLSSILTST